MHLIGFSRGGPVTSEIAHRLGLYFPTIPDLQVTTLDPHFKPQPSLDVPIAQYLGALTAAGALLPGVAATILAGLSAGLLGVAAATGDTTLHYGDFHDPTVTAWQNETLADNYWEQNAGKGPVLLSFTPNGDSVPNADINLDLNGRPGFTQDGGTLPSFGLGEPQLRVKAWYAGTVDLGLTQFAGQVVGSDQISRTLPTSAGFTGPWYSAREGEAAGTPQAYAPSEGIGEGWFYSILGGGRTTGQDPITPAPSRTPLTPVASVDNGDFQASIRPTVGRFPVAISNPLSGVLPFPPDWRANYGHPIPGWSFQGGSGGSKQGDHLVELAQLGDFAAQFPQIGTVLNQVVPGLVLSPQGQTVGIVSKLLKALGQSDPDPTSEQKLETMRSTGLINDVLELKGQASGGTDTGTKEEALTQITHNREYIPPNTQSLEFQMRVVDPNPNEELQVWFTGPDNRWYRAGTFSLGDATSGFIDQHVSLAPTADFPDFRGTVARFAFKLAIKGDRGGPDVPNTQDLTSKVWLDNIRLSSLLLNAPVPGAPSAGATPSDQTPLFSWSLSSGSAVASKVYVSTHAPGQGLFPTDGSLDDNPAHHINGNPDTNPTRIVNGVDVGAATSYQLPAQLRLTAGQTYYWGVDVTTSTGGTYREWASFQTAPVAAASGTFSSVTLITPDYRTAQGLTQDALALAQLIAQHGGNGVVEQYYNSQTGTWDGPAPQLGKPLVLVTDWSQDAQQIDQGFAEAAGDALFADLARLNAQQGGALLASPLHLIGIDCGAVVNSVIVQRLGTYDAATVGQQVLPDGTVVKHTDLQVTTLDPPRPFDYQGFQEVPVQVWQNETFADNYYQTYEPAATGTQGPAFTPNGQALSGANINLNLDDRAGFTFAAALQGPGSVDERVLRWYAGTVDLSVNVFPDNGGGGTIFRRLADQDAFQGNGQPPTLPRPWYVAQESTNPPGFPYYLSQGQPNTNAPWEGIGEGWFYSVLGGGMALRPTLTDRSLLVPLDHENHSASNQVRQRGDYPVPTVFDGNFDAFWEAGSHPASEAVPGWSFDNGAQPVLFSNLGDRATLSPGPEGPGPSPDYALDLQPNTSVTHDRLMVPAWGDLRFDVYAPFPMGGQLTVTITNVRTGTATTLGTVQLVYGDGFTDPNGGSRPVNDQDTYKLTYGMEGFETFDLLVPTSFRGQDATLTFAVTGSTSDVYLDDVFFGTKALQFGNPSGATSTVVVLTDAQGQQHITYALNGQLNNYLIEKPQYTESFNGPDKIPNWVAWELNAEWPGPIRRDDIKPSNPFRPDPRFPSYLNPADTSDYSNSGFDQGHMFHRHPDTRRQRAGQQR
jgi:hypothetical protein